MPKTFRFYRLHRSPCPKLPVTDWKTAEDLGGQLLNLRPRNGSGLMRRKSTPKRLSLQVVSQLSSKRGYFENKLATGRKLAVFSKQSLQFRPPFVRLHVKVVNNF